jgi:hypothetical protein
VQGVMSAQKNVVVRKGDGCPFKVKCNGSRVSYAMHWHRGLT